MWFLLIPSIPLFALPVAYFVWLAVLYRRPPVTGTSVVAQYEPPTDILPAEAAFLLDGTLKPRAIAAMLVDLKIRRELDIVETASGTVAEFHAVTDAPRATAAHERLLLSSLFGDGDATDVKTAARRLAAAAPMVQRAVKDGLKEKGMLAGELWHEEIMFAAAVGAAAIIFLGAIPAFGFVGALGAGAALVLIAQFAYVAASWRPRLSEKGRAAALHLMGFREYLRQVEGDYIQWQEKTERVLNIWTPFAIVFDVSLAWATKLQSLTSALLKNILP